MKLFYSTLFPKKCRAGGLPFHGKALLEFITFSYSKLVPIHCSCYLHLHYRLLGNSNVSLPLYDVDPIEEVFYEKEKTCDL